MIGRILEINRLNDSINSESSELVAVYGRRRVGKTYLIRTACKSQIKFEITGLFKGTTAQQLGIFFRELQSRSNKFLNKE